MPCWLVWSYISIGLWIQQPFQTCHLLWGDFSLFSHAVDCVQVFGCNQILQPSPSIYFQDQAVSPTVVTVWSNLEEEWANVCSSCHLPLTVPSSKIGWGEFQQPFTGEVCWEDAAHATQWRSNFWWTIFLFLPQVYHPIPAQLQWTPCQLQPGM